MPVLHQRESPMLPRRIAGLLLALVLAPSLPAVLARAQDAPSLQGHLEQRDGIRLLYLWGTPAQRGRAEGYLLAEEILDCFRDFMFGAGLHLSPRTWDGAIVPLVRTRIDVNERTAQRLKGLILGIQEKLPEERRVIPELKRPLSAEDLLTGLAISDFLGFFCSSFVATGETLEEGEGPLVGRNLDYPGSPKLMSYTLVRIDAPGEGTFGTMGFGWPGLLGCVTGISDQGLTLAVHDVPCARPTEIKLTPRLMALGELLETLRPDPDCAAVAADRLRTYSFAFGMNAMLAWRASEAAGGAVLEVDTARAREQGVSVRTMDGLPYIVCTNHHRRRSSGFQCDRYDTLTRGCDLVLGLEHEPLTFDSGWVLLSRATVADTLYRCLIDLETGRGCFQARSAPREEFREPFRFDVDDLFARVEKLKAVLR